MTITTAYTKNLTDPRYGLYDTVVAIDQVDT